MIDDNDLMTQHRLNALRTDGTWSSVECLSNLFQRVRMLHALSDTPADLRDLMDELAIPRTTLHRNLSLLEQQGWIKRISSGYTTTIMGNHLTDIFFEMLERVHRIESLAPFLNEVDLPTTIDIDQLNEIHVTTPGSPQPYAPMLRLMDIFDTAEHMRTLSPIVSELLAKRYYRSNEATYEFIFSRNAIDARHRPDTDEWRADSKTRQNTRINIRIYDGELPYGLFVCEDTLALAAYDGGGRIRALVESESERTIKWGKRKYETYSDQSQ